MLSLFYRCLGRVGPVDVEADATVGQLLECIAASSGLRAGRMKLLFQGVELKDRGAALADCSLSMQATVEVVLRPVGPLPVVAVRGYSFSSALARALMVLDDGSVVDVQGDGDVTPVLADAKVGAASVACCSTCGLVLYEDGTVRVTPEGEDWKPPDVAPKKYVSVACGDGYCFGVLDDGTVFAWNKGSEVTPLDNGGMHVVRVQSGGAHTMAMTACGRVVTWNDVRFCDPLQELPDGKSPEGVVSMSVGELRSVAVLDTGRLCFFGPEALGCGTLPPEHKPVLFAAVSRRTLHVMYGEPGQQELVSFGYSGHAPRFNSNDVVDLCVDQGCWLAVTRDGSVCWDRAIDLGGRKVKVMPQ